MSSKAETLRGGVRFWAGWGLFLKILIKTLVIAAILAAAAFYYFDPVSDQAKESISICWQGMKMVKQWKAQHLYTPEYAQEWIDYYKQGLIQLYYHNYVLKFLEYLFIGMAGMLILYRLVDYIFLRKDSVRGTEFVEPDVIQKMIQKDKKAFIRAFLGKFPVSSIMETMHTVVLGASGSGKTESVIAKILALSLRLGLKGVAVDSKGDLISRFFCYEDAKYVSKLFNILDPRSIGYSVMNDIESITDANRFTKSLITEGIPGSEDESFREGARKIAKGLLYYAKIHGLKKNIEIYELLALAQKKKHELLLSIGVHGVEGAGVLDPESPKTASSYNSTLIKFIEPLKLMKDGEFSIRKWVRSDEGGFIFCANTPDIQDTTKPAITLFINFLASFIMELPESNDRRVPIIIDEFASLHAMEAIVTMITKARSRGACIYYGVQDIPQVLDIYGENKTRSILGSTSTKIVMRLEEDLTATWMESIFGELIYTEPEHTMTTGSSEHRDNHAYKTIRRREPLVLAGEMMGLRGQNAIIKCGSWYTKVDLHSRKLFLEDKSKLSYPVYIQRDDILFDNIRDEFWKSKEADNVNEAKSADIYETEFDSDDGKDK